MLSLSWLWPIGGRAPFIAHSAKGKERATAAPPAPMTDGKLPYTRQKWEVFNSLRSDGIGMSIG